MNHFEVRLHTLFPLLLILKLVTLRIWIFSYITIVVTKFRKFNIDILLTINTVNKCTVFFGLLDTPRF